MVLNQSDRLRPEERGAVLDSLAGIVRAEGLTAAPVLATSATTGEGLEELREHLVAIARSQEAAAFRQRADLTAAADRLHEVADPAGLPAAADPADVDALAQDLAVAARVDEVATAVGSSYRYRAGNRVGWPPLRWLRRVRPDPLRRWNIGQQRDGQGLERTSLPEPDAASAARASGGVRRLAEDRKSTRLNSSHVAISYAVFCVKKKSDTSMHYNVLHALCVTESAPHRALL